MNDRSISSTSISLWIIQSSLSTVIAYCTSAGKIMQMPLKSSTILLLRINNGSWNRSAISYPTSIFSSCYFCKALHTPSSAPWILRKPIVLIILRTKPNYEKWVSVSSGLTIETCSWVINTRGVWVKIKGCLKHDAYWACISHCSLDLLLIILCNSLVSWRPKDLNTIHAIIKYAFPASFTLVDLRISCFSC